MIYIAVYITDNCNTCARVVSSAKSIVQQYSTLELQVKNISELNDKYKIVPAIFIDNKLFCYGEFDKNKFIDQITSE